MSDGPYCFDDGLTAFVHPRTQISDPALTSVYGFANEDASALMGRFMDAKRLHWHEEMPEETVRGGFERDGQSNVDGWGGYYAQVAAEEGAETILTVDDDFDQFDDVAAEVVLSPSEFATLNDFLGY